MKLFHFVLTNSYPQIIPVVDPLVSERENINSPIHIKATDLEVHLCRAHFLWIKILSASNILLLPLPL